MPKFSIILPVYNTEKYIKECVDSVLAQTFHDYECIVIDDGCTDNSIQIIEKCIGDNKKFHIYHENNSGLSVARNFGISKAEGEYLVFLDSDDFLDKNALNILNSELNSRDIDVIVSNTNEYYEKSQSLIKKRLIDDKLDSEILDGENAFKYCINNKNYISSAWMFTVNRNYLLNNKLWFYPSIFHEDVLWAPFVFLNANKVLFNSVSFYCNRCSRENSIINSYNEKKIYDKIQIIDEIISKSKVFSFSKRSLLSIWAAKVYVGTLVDVYSYRNSANYNDIKMKLNLRKKVLLRARLKDFLLYCCIALFGVNFCSDLLKHHH